MTTQEIREMLGSTITANGKREISGQSLNAALNAMVDVLEERSQFKATDVVLDKNSNNPIANSAVATAIEEVSNDIDSIREEIGIDRMLMFDMSSGGIKLREYFTEYNLANKLNTPIACLVKFNSFEKATVATVVVEGFDAAGKYDGTEMYKITFATFGFKTKAVAGIDPGGNFYIPRYVWSSDIFINGGISKSYLYTPSTNLIQGLGDGTMYNSPQYVSMFKKNLDYNKLQFGRIYYVFEMDEDNPSIVTLDSILVSAEAFDDKGRSIGIGWYNIKDGAFDNVYNWR